MAFFFSGLLNVSQAMAFSSSIFCKTVFISTINTPVPTVQAVQPVRSVQAPTSFLPRDAGEDEGGGLNAFERFFIPSKKGRQSLLILPVSHGECGDQRPRQGR